ncbi:MAG: CRISPR-associated endonuclease Cas2 [Prevotella sp.]|nr:CRISPR-associated endonuclease Cas2 [Prevotella sp.]
MTEHRLNSYHIMWLFVFFDLPVTTKKERKIATVFRKDLLKDGFVMMQFSVYIRHCASHESLVVHKRRIKMIMPATGKVSMLAVTDKQYGDIETVFGKSAKKEIRTPIQLEFF